MKRRHKYSIDDAKEIAREKGGECLSTEYVNNKIKLRWKCLVCNHEWDRELKGIIVQNSWCPVCAKCKKHTIEDAKEIAREKGGECLSTEYLNNKQNLTWKCDKCSHIWSARLDRIIQLTWCPRCKESRGEKIIRTYLQKNLINYKREYIFKDQKNRRYDFYLPEKNTLIEYDGIQHFQIYKKYSATEDQLKKIQERDIEKTKYALKNNFKFLRICYMDLNKSPQIIQDFLNSDSKKIFSSPLKYKYITDNLFLTGIGEQ